MNTLEAYEERVLNKTTEQRRKAVRDCRFFIRLFISLMTGVTAFVIVYLCVPAVAYGESLSMRCFIAVLTFVVMLDLLHHELNHNDDHK